MAQPDLKLDVAGVNALMARAFPDAPAGALPQVTDLAPGRAHVVRAYGGGMLRPGGVISGPNLMSLADTAAYALILAHIGDQLMAVTSALVMNFLRGAVPGDLHAEASFLRLGRRIAVCDVKLWPSFLRLGRRIAVCDVKLWTESADRLAAQATVTYAIPS